MHKPKVDFDMRVYACLLIHAGDKKDKSNRARLAVFYEGNKPRPLLPGDIVTELNEQDAIGRADRHYVRRSLRNLEEEGLVRVVGTVRKKLRIYVYARPLRKRTLAPIPEEVPPLPSGEERRTEGEHLGVKSPPQIFGSSTKESSSILNLRTHIVKVFREAVRELVG